MVAKVIDWFDLRHIDCLIAIKAAFRRSLFTKDLP
jgi:hypothetical protein